ncbi:MAG TPA: NAD(P)/FAD-dependent oxidoreductase [Thermoanaerobaculia bacterium]|nr:NAD(P)/FAD-dependent oxidoreductase [Thermoanaerobaculia bacterium]
MRNEYDIAVVGAGLAGLQVARLLGARGLRVLLLDRKTSLAAPVYTTGIFVRKTWEDFPLPAEQLTTPIRDVFLYSPSARRIHLAAAEDEFRIGRMQWIYLSMLEGCSRAGVRWLPGSRVVHCAPGNIAVLRSNKTENFKVRFVIGADGARSIVAQQLGLDRNSDFLVGLEVIAASRCQPSLHCFLDPRIAPGYLAWVASDGETAHVGVAGYPRRFNPALALDAFRLRVKHLAGSRVIERRGGMIPVNGILRRIGCSRGLLVGDAAGAVSPLTAGGLDAAMRLSTFAAEVTAAYLAREDPAILREYDGARFQARFVARRWMRSMLSVCTHPAVMEAVFTAMRTPALLALARHIFFSRGSFPELSSDHLLFARNHSANAG